MYTVILHEEGTIRDVGTVSEDTLHHLTLISAPDDMKERLADILKELNGQEKAHIEVPPPSGAPRGSYSHMVERTDPAFGDAQRESLMKYHDLELVPIKENP